MAFNPIVKNSNMVSINQQTMPSHFHFDIADVSPSVAGVYGIRVFFRNPTMATREVLNAFSMWGGPDKTHWDHPEIYEWEFTRERIIDLHDFVKIATRECLVELVGIK